MKRMLVKSGAVILALFAGSFCLAQGPQMRPGGMGEGGPGGQGEQWREGMLERILNAPELVKEVGLSEEQVTKLKESGLEMKKEQIRLQADLKLAALEQAELIQNRDSSESDIMAAVEKTGKVRTEIAKLHMKRLITVRETLTQEQQDRIRKLVHRHMRKRMEAAEMRDRPRMQEGRGERPRQGGDRPGVRGMRPRAPMRGLPPEVEEAPPPGD